MGEFKSKYQLAIIPKGVNLFRKAIDKRIYESMYFYFMTNGTYSSDYCLKPTQIWVTTKPIISRLIVEEKLSPNGHLLNDLTYCYRQFCGEEEYYLNIKNRNNPNAKPFLAFLKSNSIDSWVTPVENKHKMELHLFADDNNSVVEFKEELDKNKELAVSNVNTFEEVILLNTNDYICTV